MRFLLSPPENRASSLLSRQQSVVTCKGLEAHLALTFFCFNLILSKHSWFTVPCPLLLHSKATQPCIHAFSVTVHHKMLNTVSSLCYTVGLCCPSIPHTIVWHLPIPNSQYFLPHHHALKSPHKSTLRRLWPPLILTSYVTLGKLLNL